MYQIKKLQAFVCPNRSTNSLAEQLILILWLGMVTYVTNYMKSVKFAKEFLVLRF
ncbi:hypothetical protein DRN94_004330 [archaeon]|nr:hypothetical protein [archaeon]